MVHKLPVFIFGRHPTKEVLVPVDVVLESLDIVLFELGDTAVQSDFEGILKVGLEVSVVRSIQEIPELLYNARASRTVYSSVVPVRISQLTYREVCMANVSVLSTLC